MKQKQLKQTNFAVKLKEKERDEFKLFKKLFFFFS